MTPEDWQDVARALALAVAAVAYAAMCVAIYLDFFAK